MKKIKHKIVEKMENRRSVFKKIGVSLAAVFGVGVAKASTGSTSKKVVSDVVLDQDVPLFSGAVRHGITVIHIGKTGKILNGTDA